MKIKMTRVLTTLLAVMLCMTVFSANALAVETTTSPAQTDTSTTTPTSSSKPLTPDGTGTVTDNVTNEDGKEFFTITTPSKHVFYLIIDRQKDSENVYFLDAVTEKDLLALAQSEGQNTDNSSSSKVTTTPEASSSPTVSTPTAPSDSQPEKQNSGAAVAAVAVCSRYYRAAACVFKSASRVKPKTSPIRMMPTMTRMRTLNPSRRMSRKHPTRKRSVRTNDLLHR